MRAALSVFLLLVVATVSAAVEPPRARTEGEWVTVTLSGTLLDDESVRRRATSGLTATLVIIDRSVRGERPSAARLSLRYEPWDEVFLVTVVHSDGERENDRVGTIDKLRDYLASTVIRIRRATARPPAELSLEVKLVPFSSEEAVDAREWFLDTLGSTPKGTSNGGISSVEGVVDVLLATSIQARPVASWTWKVPVRTRGEGDP